jgi:hypothetical protein
MSHRYQSLPSIIKDLQGVHSSLRDMNATCYLLFPCCRGGAPAEWSRWNVSLRLAVAPAWPAELVGVAQPATRRMQARTPLVLAAYIRSRRGA